ncbi:MAG: hypothetical protein AB1411_02620 [Nitrospirota bacterium]
MRQRYWTNRATVNVFRVIGTQHPDYQGLTWLEFLKKGKRMGRNLGLYEANPSYYTDIAVKEPTMYYRTLDGGLSYYVAEDGNHRSAIARFDCWYRGDLLLHGVTVTDLRIDWELARLYSRLQTLIATGGARMHGKQVEPVTRRVSREDGPGWMLETFTPVLRVRDGAQVFDVGSAEAMDVEQRWLRLTRRPWWVFWT